MSKTITCESVSDVATAATAGLVISRRSLPAVAGPVLVVAAGRLQRHRLATLFGRAGFRIVVTGDTDEALRVLAQVNPRAVVVATPVPGTDWSVLATLARPAQVVIVTADAWQSAKAHALDCEAVARPDQAVGVLARLRRWTGSHDDGRPLCAPTRAAR